MLNILSHSTSPLKKEWWKHMITRHVLQIHRGPDAVRESLFRGLARLHIPYTHNHVPLSGTVLVLSGSEALKEAIAAKMKGDVKRLIAGPNITIHPSVENKLMCSSSIDAILVPSPWTRDFWSSEAPELAKKIFVWPAGVPIVTASTRSGRPIIYNKLQDETLLSQIVHALPDDPIVFRYGKFSQSKYLKALQDAPYIIYLAESESQGLALQEAWAHNVPTLVNKSNRCQRGVYSWDAPHINAPYLNEEVGRIFSQVAELPSLISEVSQINPKKFCDRELSDEKTTTELLKIL